MEINKYQRLVTGKIVEAVQFTDQNKNQVYSWIKQHNMSVQPCFDRDNNPILKMPIDNNLEICIVCHLNDYVILKENKYVDFVFQELFKEDYFITEED